MEINERDAVLKNAAGVLYIIIKENVLPKPGWYIQIIKSPFFHRIWAFRRTL